MFKVSTHKTCHRPGCHSGVVMDDDTYFEGYERDVVYQPCECHPSHCPTCHGTGWAPEEIAEKQNKDDCPDCNGGWRGEAEHPDYRYADPEQWKLDRAEDAA